MLLTSHSARTSERCSGQSLAAGREGLSPGSCRQRSESEDMPAAGRSVHLLVEAWKAVPGTCVAGTQ